MGKGGCDAYHNWHARQRLRVKALVTVSLFVITIVYHLTIVTEMAIFASANGGEGPLAIHGMMIFMGMISLGPHGWFVLSLLNTLNHDDAGHRKVIAAYPDRSRYHQYYGEMVRNGETPLDEATWAKENKVRTIWI